MFVENIVQNYEVYLEAGGPDLETATQHKVN
jgi:hypothetical protein